VQAIVIGVLSDSLGDLDAFDAAYELLRARGARRFIFAGGRYADLEEWILRRRERARGGRDYSDADFLEDIGNFLVASEQVRRPAAFEEEEPEDWEQLKERFLRVPDKESLQYLDAGVANKTVDLIGDVLCCIVHDKNDLTRDDLLNALVFIHGRQKEPAVVQIGPRYFMTPGPLAGGVEQTCGLLEQDLRNLRFSAFRLDGRTLIDRQLLALDRRTKLSVK
jgi:hypothetical protein